MTHPGTGGTGPSGSGTGVGWRLVGADINHVTQARQAEAAARTEAALKRVVDAAPPLTDDQLIRLAAILRPARTIVDEGAAGDAWWRLAAEIVIRSAQCRPHRTTARPHTDPNERERMSNLVDHARRELELSGQTEESPAYAASIVAAVAAFASYGGHSGGTAMIAVEQLHALLQFRTLSPLTSDPEEWEDRSAISASPLWQNRRDSAAVSTDGGQTWTFVDDRKASA